MFSNLAITIATPTTLVTAVEIIVKINFSNIKNEQSPDQGSPEAVYDFYVDILNKVEANFPTRYEIFLENNNIQFKFTTLTCKSILKKFNSFIVEPLPNTDYICTIDKELNKLYFDVLVPTKIDSRLRIAGSIKNPSYLVKNIDLHVYRMHLHSSQVIETTINPDVFTVIPQTIKNNKLQLAWGIDYGLEVAPSNPLKIFRGY